MTFKEDSEDDSLCEEYQVECAERNILFENESDLANELVLYNSISDANYLKSICSF